jgi:sugar lactone lactonase YvrE
MNDTAIRTVADGFHFLEAPRWREGRLLASDFFLRGVFSFAADGGMQKLCDVPDQPSGLGFLPDGDLIIVSMTDRKLLRFDGDRLSEYADLQSITPFHCNDLLVDAAGGAYVGNFGWDLSADLTVRPTNLIRVDPDGRPRVVAEDLVFPNGMVLTPDGQTLLVAETFAARIAAYDVQPDGGLGGRRTWAAFAEGPFTTVEAAVRSGVPLPDGMALDANGHVWIGDAAGRGPSLVAEGGEIVDRIDTGDLAAYAVTLGGVDRRTLFMCAGPPMLSSDPSAEPRARLLAADVATPGAGRP